MTATCPQGHPSTSLDYCDTCGAKMTTGPAPEPPAGPSGRDPSATPPASAPVTPASTPCPHCGTSNPAGALFCEACGYDFTTGALPRGRSDPAPPAPASTGHTPIARAVEQGWVAENWVDPEWYAEQDAEETCPSPGLPVVVPLTVRSLLVERVSSIEPQLCLKPTRAVVLNLFHSIPPLHEFSTFV